MPRKLKDTALDTPTARSRLAPRADPYWRRISRTCHLGYRRNRSGAGTWVGRFYDGARYIKRGLGSADDLLPANGASILSFDQVQAAAREWFTMQARRAAGEVTAVVGPYTVAQAVEDYLAAYGANGKALTETRAAVEAHLLPALGHRLVSSLTAAELRFWLRGLVKRGPRVRSRRGETPRFRELDATATEEERAEWERRRKATANRIWTYLRAALNHAFAEGRVESDAEWRRVKPFRGVEKPRVRFLSLAEADRLLESCLDPDFRELAHGALVTGCRYGELTRMLCVDFKPEVRKVHVCRTKGGKPRFVALTEEGVELFTHLTAGKPAAALIFTKGGRSWGKSEQQRPLAQACREAALSPPISFHGLRHTYGAQLAMQGVSLQVIAAAYGHADTRLTERWYAHLLPSYVDDTVRANLPTFSGARSSLRRLEDRRAQRKRDERALADLNG